MESLSEALNAFTRFHEAISPHSAELVELFTGQLSTSADQIRAIFETPEFSNFHFAHWSRGKCNSTAEQFKNDARDAYLGGCMAKALSNINSAILWIEQTGCVKGVTSGGAADEYDPNTATMPSTLATLHEFRANIMQDLGRYEDCLKELNRMKMSGYPACTFHRFARAQSECYAKMGQLHKATELMECSIGELNELISSATNAGTRVLPVGATLVTLEQEKFEFMGFLASLRSRLASVSCRRECSCGDHAGDDQMRVAHKAERQLGMDLDSSGGCVDCAGKGSPADRAVELDDGENTTNGSISAAVEFEEGGKIRAAKDIRPGAILIKEQPLAAVLHAETWWSRCHQCLCRCDTFVACKTCSMSVYCSEDCREEALAQHHKYECPMMGTLSAGSFRGTPLLAVRMISLAGPSVLQPDTPTYANFCEVLRALAAKQGCGFSDARSAVDAAVTAVFLANVMVRNNAFVKDILHGTNGADIGERTLALALSLSEALLELMKVLPANQTHVTELLTRPTPNWMIQSSYEATIGCSASPITRSVTYSCFPNCYLRFQDGHSVVSSILPIVQGEPLTVALTFKDFMTCDKAGRDYALAELEPKSRGCWGCVACAENWPCLPDMCPSVFQVKCFTCKQLLPDSTETNGLAEADAQPLVVDEEITEGLGSFSESCQRQPDQPSARMSSTDVSVAKHNPITFCPYCKSSVEEQEACVQRYLDGLDAAYEQMVASEEKQGFDGGKRFDDHVTAAVEAFFEDAMVTLSPVVALPHCRRFFVGYRALQRIHARRGFAYSFGAP